MNNSNHFCSDELMQWMDELEVVVRPIQAKTRAKAEKNYFKILKAFQNTGISDFHFQGSTGYGYGDVGRDLLDQLYAEVFGAEAALVRPQIVSGTHAIALCFFGLLRPGDEILSVTGKPYDSLSAVLGDGEHQDGSLSDWGINHVVLPLKNGVDIDYHGIEKAINNKTKMIAIQRSRGYSIRPSITIKEIKEIIKTVKDIKQEIICFVDNCYGEFVEGLEPTQVGADVIAGSLIKNPGGGLAPTGGYIVGKEELVERISKRLTAPGLGADLGSHISSKHLYYQGLFLAPLVVQEALSGAILTAKAFSKLGFQVSPQWNEARTDIIQAIILNTKENLLAFCHGLQIGSPIDSHITPIPSEMPGYSEQIIMAGGTFIQGSSIELSVDGPLREPYAAYLQGGLAYPYVKAGLLTALQFMIDQKLISI